MVEDETGDFVPTQIGHYPILRRLGAAGRVVSYLAHDPDRGREVVLRCHAEPITPDRREAALAAAHTLTRVRSPYLVPCLGAGRDGDHVFLVFEPVPGTILAQSMPGRPRDPASAARLVAQLAEGVAALNAFGLDHGDVSPANVLIGPDDKPRLIGLGLTSDGPTDVAGLGAILYEAMTGRPWSPGQTPPRQVNPAIPRQLEAICLKALADDPARRYPSVTALQQALRRWGFVSRPSTRPLGLAGAILVLILLVFAMRHATFRPSAPPDPTIGSTHGARRPLDGQVTVSVGPPGATASQGRMMGSPGASPVRKGERARVEARLNEPAYVYLYWIDGEGRAERLSPPGPGFESAATAPKALLQVPVAWDEGKPVAGPSGLVTVLLLARPTPLPNDNALDGEIILPPTPFRDPREFVIFGFDRASPRPHVIEGQFRGLKSDAEVDDDSVLDLLKTLSPRFEFARAVRFPFKDE